MCICPHVPDDGEEFENKTLSAESKDIIYLHLARTKNILLDKQGLAKSLSNDLKSLNTQIEKLEKKIMGLKNDISKFS